MMAPMQHEALSHIHQQLMMSLPASNALELSTNVQFTSMGFFASCTGLS
jgi:hypothetical protein